jgi:hypothetical protein
VIGVPAREPAGKYEAGFGEGDENLFRRRFARWAEEGGFSKNNGLAALATRHPKKFSIFG